MQSSQRLRLEQQERVLRRAGQTDRHALFNILNGPQLLDRVEHLLPAHRGRLFPPTESRSMFSRQVLSVDGSCQQAVPAAADPIHMCE